MGGKRLSTIEKILHRAEDHIEEWRSRDQARKAEAEAGRDKLWAEAKEREKLLAKTIDREEPQRRSAGRSCRKQRAVFVIHSCKAKEALKGLSREGVRFARMIPAEGISRGDAVLEGSWLIFE
jgi:hypothetical protein